LLRSRRCCDMEPRRFRNMSRTLVLGREVPVARGLRARLLGLALLRRRRSGPGLLIPRCRAVHTIGMRFPLDLVFLDAWHRPLRVLPGVPPCRLVACLQASAVLELPAGRLGGDEPGRPGKAPKGGDMSIIDKLTGRAKKAAADIADDPSLRREGRREEQKGKKKEKLGEAQEEVEHRAQEVGDLERKT
jgi:uncharacterized protein